MQESKSIRGRLIALQVGGKLIFRNGKENTIRNTACVVGGLSGKKFRVRKKETSIVVYRYE